MREYLIRNYDKYKPFSFLILASSIIFLFTFPATEPDFGRGLDISYVWAFNHLFADDYIQLTGLAYPFGPLGYLKFPLPVGSNLETGTLVFSALKMLFIISLLLLLNDNNRNRNISVTSAGITLIISYFCDIDLLITGLCVIYGIFYIRKNNLLFFIAAAAFASLGLFIKSAIGVSSFSVIGAIIAVSWFNSRQVKQAAVLLAASVLVLFSAGMVVFRNPAMLLSYLVNVSGLTLGYSSALAVYPENNWLALSVFLITVFTLPVLVREREPRLLWFILLIPLFIAWKHSMSREDLTHNKIMLYFLFFFWGMALSLSKDRRKLIFLLASLSILAWYRNMSQLPGYRGYRIEISGINNFYNSVIEIGKFREKYAGISAENLLQSKMPPEATGLIGDSTIDFYPWELSYAPANDLNWQPRVNLQSGSFSRWLDRKSSLFFDDGKGAEYILFHQVADRHGGSLGSIDDRYILNDEPLTIISMIRNYTVTAEFPGFILMKKTGNPLQGEPEIISSGETEWEKWIDIPDHQEGGILRACFHCRESLAGKIKSVLYKGGSTWIDYMLSDGRTLTYRFNRLNSMDGLWISPFYSSSIAETPRDKVLRIRFRCDERFSFRSEVEVAFQRYDFSVSKVSSPGFTSPVH